MFGRFGIGVFLGQAGGEGNDVVIHAHLGLKVRNALVEAIVVSETYEFFDAGEEGEFGIGGGAMITVSRRFSGITILLLPVSKLYAGTAMNFLPVLRSNALPAT